MPEKLTNTQLSEIRARCEAATPGTWECTDPMETDKMKVMDTVGEVCKTDLYGFEYPECWSNGDFIAHARTDIPALLAHIDEQRAEIEYLKRTIGYLAVAFSDFTMSWDVPSVNAEIEIAEAFTLAKKPDKDCEWMTINGYVDGAIEILRERSGGNE